MKKFKADGKEFDLDLPSRIVSSWNTANHIEVTGQNIFYGLQGQFVTTGTTQELDLLVFDALNVNSIDNSKMIAHLHLAQKTNFHLQPACKNGLYVKNGIVAVLWSNTWVSSPNPPGDESQQGSQYTDIQFTFNLEVYGGQR